MSSLISRLLRRDRPMRRLTDSELTTEHDYLENIQPAEQNTLDNQCRAAEYIAQRYLPADTKITEAQWQGWRRTTRARIAATMAGHSPPTSSPNPDFLAWMDAELGREP